MSTINRPVPFPGTPEQAQRNRDTHHWDTYDGDNWSCCRCDSKPWHAAASYPCGDEPPRERVTLPDDPAEAASVIHPGLHGGAR